MHCYIIHRMRYIALLMCLFMQISVDAQSVQKLVAGRVLDKESSERNGKQQDTTDIPFKNCDRWNIAHK